MQRVIVSLAANHSCRNGGEEKGKKRGMEKERREKKEEMMIIIIKNLVFLLLTKHYTHGMVIGIIHNLKRD